MLKVQINDMAIVETDSSETKTEIAKLFHDQERKFVTKLRSEK